MKKLHHKDQNQEEENGKTIDDVIKTSPLLLDRFNSVVEKVGNYYLPYSTGFEIECNLQDGVNSTNFDYIKDVIEMDINGYEQRFRIPTGIVGLQTLQLISQALKKFALLNPGSGIHYHIDFTECYDNLTSEFINNNSKWILKELDKWDYKGSYNSRCCAFNSSHNWVRFQDGYKTMEIRIGEMTFDYELLFTRITHANDIARKLKSLLVDNVIELYKDDYEDDINNRIIKI